MNVSEIAKLANVSNATVSRYFNDGYVSKEKREAIRKVVEETGYRPLAQAQTLRTKKTKMIGVIVPKIASAAIGRVVEGILSVLNEKGYQMLLAVTQNNPQKELEYLDAFCGRQVDGVILSATTLTAEHKRRFKRVQTPFVIVGQQLKGNCCVFHDDYHATYDLTTYILKKGRKNLGYLCAPQKDPAVGERRRKGYLDAVRDMGCKHLAEHVVTASFDMESGYEKAKELFASYQDLDAVICATDAMAGGGMRYLKEGGVRVPSQVLVAGHDDSDLARVTSPPLLTVHYSYEKSGELAVKMLMEMLEGQEAFVKEMMLGYSIVDAARRLWEDIL